MKKCLASLLAACAVALVAAAAQAADYYVATNGSTGAAGTMATPWTFAKAVSSKGAGPGEPGRGERLQQHADKRSTPRTDAVEGG